jgi:hypothetical protein
MPNREEKVGAAVIALVEGVRHHPRHILRSQHRRRRTARRALGAAAEAITALSLVRRGSRRGVASLAAAAYIFDRLARRAAHHRA